MHISRLLLLQATGLALPGADLDVVVLGAHSELQNPAQGYSHEARNAISDLLEVSVLTAETRASRSLLAHGCSAVVCSTAVGLLCS